MFKVEKNNDLLTNYGVLRSHRLQRVVSRLQVKVTGAAAGGHRVSGPHPPWRCMAASRRQQAGRGLASRAMRTADATPAIQSKIAGLGSVVDLLHRRKADGQAGLDHLQQGAAAPGRW